MAKADTTLTVRIEPDPEFEEIAADIQSAAEAIREMYTSVKEIVDALQLILKKLKENDEKAT